MEPTTTVMMDLHMEVNILRLMQSILNVILATFFFMNITQNAFKIDDSNQH